MDARNTGNGPIEALVTAIEILVNETRNNQRIMIVALCIIAGAKEILTMFKGG